MISVVIPALNEEATIAEVVSFALRSSIVGEVLVIDDGSLDKTSEKAQAAGARVLTSSMLGKGASMADGLREAAHELVLYLDGDLKGVVEDLVERMVVPLLRDEADLVKASFTRHSGRVTTLTAKPLLQAFFPELQRFSQPLGGIMAASRQLLMQLDFTDDYGVDVGLLIDAHLSGARITEVDIGYLIHDPQTLESLGRMAGEVVQSILQRAERYGRMAPHYVQGRRESMRHARAKPELLPLRSSTHEPVLLLPMDYMILQRPYLQQLAAACGKQQQFARIEKQTHTSVTAQLRSLTRLFHGVHQKLFEEVARTAHLREQVIETVIELRRAGWRIGIVEHCYYIATEIVRRRVFADFSVANMTVFENEHCSGELVFSPALSYPAACKHEYCKSGLVRHLGGMYNIPTNHITAVGIDRHDLCLLKHSGTSVAIAASHKRIRKVAQLVVKEDELRTLPELLANHAW